MKSPSIAFALTSSLSRTAVVFNIPMVALFARNLRNNIPNTIKRPTRVRVMPTVIPATVIVLTRCWEIRAEPVLPLDEALGGTAELAVMIELGMT